MLTVWGQKLDENSILPEYPRPQLKRDSWLNLNGRWDFTVNDSPEPPESFEGSILVPFSPEAELSRAACVPEPSQLLWYRRSLTLPEGFFRGRLLLHFGAVDQIARVWVNGREAGGHVGGFTPFTLDISYAAEAGDELTIVVCAQDFTEELPCGRGKQSGRPGGIWHRAQSGIWQTVWLESVPREYIRGLRLIPHLDSGELELWVAGEGECRAECPGGELTFAAGSPAVMKLGEVHPWSPESPYLYPLTLTLGEDRVQSYFALRQFSVEAASDGYVRLFLNGRTYFHNGVIDQGLWPDGLMTPPSDEALLNDIQTAKDMGFNAIRKLAKVEPARWYYHCDRLGLLVWQDIPNGGGKYGLAVSRNAPRLSDNRYALFGRADEEGRRLYASELRETVNLLYNSPCVAVWTLFNEGWGQFDARENCEKLRRIDRSRPIDAASGWHDQLCGDIRSRHLSGAKLLYLPDESGRAGAFTEFGGYVHRIEGHCFSTGRGVGARYFDSPNSFSFALRSLYREQLLPAREEGLSAAFYEQLTDVEDELSGLVTFDRRVKKLAPAVVKTIVGVRLKK